MSCVTSEIFEHNEKRTGTDYETDCEFSYDTTQKLKTYAISDKFHIEGSYYSPLQGSVSTNIQLSVIEAKRLKKQLEEVIGQHT